MKKIITAVFVTLFLLNGKLHSQTIEYVTYMQGYTEEVYYSTQSHNIVNVPKLDWDLAFQIDLMQAGIHINSPNGVSVYKCPNTDYSGFTVLDTTGVSSWQQLYNSETTWNQGAFNNNINPGNPFDYGWGIYNFQTHIVVGDSVFVVKLTSTGQPAEYFKLTVISKGLTGYDFRYATLDNSFDTTVTVLLSNYTDKNFAYYSLRNHQQLDREPITSDWDLLFTRYASFVNGLGYYNVAGVLINVGVESAQADQVDLNTVSYTNYLSSMTNNISEIGYDWKVFNQSMNQYEMVDSLCYFVKSQNDAISKITFLSFAGSATGDMSFEITNLTTSLNDNLASPLQSMALYPNVVTDNATLVLNSTSNHNGMLSIVDLNGKVIASSYERISSGINQLHIDCSKFNAGIYFVRFSDSQTALVQKMIVTKQ